MSLSSLVNDLAARIAAEIKSVWSAVGAKANDSAVVHNTGTETIGGAKTFSVAPQVPVGSLLANPVRRDDARLTDARTPLAHASTHASGGSDPITPASIGAQPAGSYQPLDADLTTIAGLSPVNGQLLRRVSGAWAASTLTASDVGAAPTTRLVSAGTGLTGGGDLSADRSLAVAYASTAPAQVAVAGAVGTANTTARGDHTHQAIQSPVANVYQTTIQSIPHNAWTGVLFQANWIDTHNGHSTSINTSRYVVPTGWAGYWLFSGMAMFVNGTTGVRLCYLRKNGVTTIPGTLARAQPASDNAGNAVVSGTGVVQMAAGDYVELMALHTQGSAVNTYATDPYLSGLSAVWLRP